MEDVPGVCRIVLEDTNSERRGKLVLPALGAHSKCHSEEPLVPPADSKKLSQKATHNLNIHRLDLTTTLAPGHRPDPLYSSLFLLLLRTYVLTHGEADGKAAG